MVIFYGHGREQMYFFSVDYFIEQRNQLFLILMLEKANTWLEVAVNEREIVIRTDSYSRNKT